MAKSQIAVAQPTPRTSTPPAVPRGREALDARVRKSKSRSGLRAKNTLITRNSNETRDVYPITIRLNGQDAVVDSPAHLAQIFNKLKDDHTFTTFHMVADKPTKLNTPEQMRPYIEALDNMPMISEISFSGVSLGIWACYALAECLRHKKNITAVDFSDVFTGRLTSEISPALDALVSAFLELPNLSTIQLSDNAFGPDVQWPLVRLLQSHLPLQHLYFNNVGLGPQTGVAVAEALTRLAEKKIRNQAPALLSFLCDRNHLVEDEEYPGHGMKEWAKALAANNGLVRVTMKNNGLRGGGLDILLRDGLSQLTRLEVLDLEDNTFSTQGQTHTVLAETVPNWPRLAQLNINDSLLGPKGAALLIEALLLLPLPRRRRSPAASDDEHNNNNNNNSTSCLRGSRLTTLKMRGNNLRPANTRALAGGFDQLPCLRHVEIADNNLPGDDAGYGALKAFLAQRSHIEKVDCYIDAIEEDEESASSM